MIEKIKSNKVLKISIMAIKAIVSFFVILVISIIFIQRISNNKITLAGYSIFTIITESMAPEYKVYDMVIAKKINPKDIKIGDDVVYLGKQSDFAGKIVTHRVIDIETKNGIDYYQTKGIANDIEDPEITGEQILGKVTFKSKILSLISRIVNNPYGFYFVIFVPFGIILVMEVIDIIEEKKSNKK